MAMKLLVISFLKGFHGGSDGKESTYNAGDLSSVPGSGKIPLVREDPPEKGMVNQSSVLACRIPWTEEPGGLQSTGSQRLEHNSVTNTHT